MTVLTPAAGTEIPAALIDGISRYCQICWRNARLPADRWADCTQDVFARLLGSLGREEWTEDLMSADSLSHGRKEFLRAIDATKKRVQRGRHLDLLTNQVADRVDGARHATREELLEMLAGSAVLSPRQRQILVLTADGHSVPDIAAILGTTPERVSDEKYRGIRKMKGELQAAARAAEANA